MGVRTSQETKGSWSKSRLRAEMVVLEEWTEFVEQGKNIGSTFVIPAIVENCM